MKNLRNFLLIFAITASFSSLYAQYNYQYQDDYPRNEIYGGLGLLTAQDATVAIKSLLVDISSAVINSIAEELGADPLNYERDTRGTIGAWSIGYNRYASARWSVGAMVNYQRYRHEFTFSNDAQGTARDRFITLMGRTDYRWVNKPNFQMYSGLALGASFMSVQSISPANIESTTTLFAFQVNPLCFRFGNQIGFFVETGLGFNGLLAAGLSGRF